MVHLKKNKHAPDMINFEPYMPDLKIKRTGFLHSASHYLLAGSTGSGKTSLMMQLLLNPEIRSKIKRLYVFNGFGDEDKWMFVKEALVERYKLNPKDVIIESDITKFPQRDSKDHFNGMESPETWIVYDDWQSSQTAALQRKINNSVTDYLTKSRKNNCSVFILSQYFYNLPTNIRNQFSGGQFIWGFKSAKMAKMWAREVCSTIDEDKVYDMYKQCVKLKHGFFTYLPQEHHKFRCGLFHEFILDDHEESSESE